MIAHQAHSAPTGTRRSYAQAAGIQFETGRERATPGPLRVLMVTPYYLPHMGGVENHVHQVGRRLAGDGVDVIVLTADSSGQLAPKECSEGIEVRRVRAWPPGRDYNWAPGIYRAITQGDWDVIHVQSYHTLVAPLAMLAAVRAHIPYVVTFHGGGHSSRLRNALRRRQRALLKPLLARAERLIAIAEFEREFLRHELDIPEKRFALIPNGCDLPSAPEPGLQREPALIASVGRLERYKGHQRAIAALPYVLAQRPDARLRIMGEGPYRAELEELAQKLGVADHVEVKAIPASDRQGMAAALGRAGLVVLFSEYETHPVAMLEALSLGCSVLVTDTSGLAELAGRGLARAIPLESSPEKVAVAILEQLSRPWMPPHVDLPTWGECADRLLSLYQSVVRSVPCGS